jgi:glycosyltransferase involved in cell wall biosynthesis
MRRFTELLHAGLAARGHTVRVLTPSLRLARLGPHYRYGGLAKYLGYFDKWVLFPRQLRREIRASRPDVVHITDHGNAPYAGAVPGVPVVVTCHDLLQIRAACGELPRQAVGRAGRWQQAWILARLARPQHIACVSAATQKDLLRLTRRPTGRSSVIPNALNHPYRPLAPAEAQARLAGLGADLRGGFVLHVGGAHWYKNRPGLLAIYAELRRRLASAPKLVMVGTALSAAELAQAEALGITPHLLFFSTVTNAQLEALYNRADALILPSWEEGFGWPIAEAQASGCPVFATDRAPMNDVGGAAAVYFDPLNPVGAARIIASAWSQRGKQRQRGLLEARRWRPELMLGAYESVYHELVR